MTDIYGEFYYTYLAEMPEVLNASAWHYQESLIMLKNELEYVNPTKLANDTYKVVDGSNAIYWVGDRNADTADIIVSTTTRGVFCKVVYTVKNPELLSGKPYASDLYLAIKHDIGKEHLVFSSDQIISSDALKLWYNLINQGHRLSVYDNQTSKYVLINVDSIDDLNRYVGGSDTRRYVFTISESEPERRGIQQHVDIMELKRLGGINLFEHLVN